jgi:hypothetical protein
MCVKREDTEDVSVHVLQRLNNRVKAELPESSSPAVEPHTHREHVWTPMSSAVINSSFVDESLWLMSDA